jgi:hypothetical protein
MSEIPQKDARRHPPSAPDALVPPGQEAAAGFRGTRLRELPVRWWR